MTNLNRRSLLLNAIPIVTALGDPALASPAVCLRQPRVTQLELNDAIRKHALWLERSGGSRAVFANRDLSGLDFGMVSDELVDLQNADFTEADMSSMTGGLISFNHASLFGARLTGSQFAEPGFISANLSHAICDHVRWGCSLSNASDQHLVNADGGVFHYTRLNRSDFSRSRVRGHFVSARFTNAKLIESDFSYSDFIGSDDETSFFQTDLIRASFANARLSAVRFSQANLQDASFADASLGGRTMQSLYLMGRGDLLREAINDQVFGRCRYSGSD